MVHVMVQTELGRPGILLDFIIDILHPACSKLGKCLHFVQLHVILVALGMK